MPLADRLIASLRWETNSRREKEPAQRAQGLRHRETIYDLHSDLVQADRATPTTQSLLAESARIVLHSTPAASAAARRLANQWHEQSLLDPDAAENTALELETELAHAESVLRVLLDRETAIAAQLKALTAEER